ASPPDSLCFDLELHADAVVGLAHDFGIDPHRRHLGFNRPMKYQLDGVADGRELRACVETLQESAGAAESIRGEDERPALGVLDDGRDEARGEARFAAAFGAGAHPLLGFWAHGLAIPGFLISLMLCKEHALAGCRS